MQSTTARRVLAVALATVLAVPAATAAQPVQTSGSSGSASPAGQALAVPDDVITLPASPSPAARMRAVASLAPTSRALLTTTGAFPDALASGALQRDAMLLGVAPDGDATAAVEAIRAAGVTDVTILGGVAAVPESVVSALPDGVAVTRIGGPERTATAALIARTVPATDTVLLARARGSAENPSQGYIDSIAAGAWSAATGWPVLLVDNGRVSADTRAAIDDIDPSTIVVIGGEAAVPESVAQEAAAGRDIRRISGATRNDTAAAIAVEQAPDGADTVFLVDGTEVDSWQVGFPAAHPAAILDGVILLADGARLPEATAGALARLAPETIHCLTAVAQVCVDARAAADMPPVPDVIISPAPGQPLRSGATVEATAGAPDASTTVRDDGDCVSVTDAGQTSEPSATARADLRPGASCTVVFRVEQPGAVGQTVTAHWPAVVLSSTTAVGGRDYATEQVGNRWDYRQLIDARVDPSLGSGDQSGRVDTAEGVLEFDGERGAVPLLWSVVPGAAPIAPDGLILPIDTNTYDQLLMRVHTSTRGGWQLEFRSCSTAREANCLSDPVRRGVLNGEVAAGWQTLHIDLSQHPEWQGDVHHLWFNISGGPARIADVRILDHVPTDAITIAADPEATLTWDTDPDPADNGDPTSPDHGPLHDRRLATAELPPGTYWIHTGAGETFGPVTLTEPPGPRRVDPTAGKADWATTVRGNPWDMLPGAGGPAGTDDLESVGGVQTAAVTPEGVLWATNADDDPHIVLALPQPIDTRVWHTITVTFANDGPLDLGYGPGGGTHGRILFKHAGHFNWRDTNDIVNYGNQLTYTLDLRHPAAIEVGQPAWDAAPVTALRFDPNEDPGAGRRWRVESVRLTGDAPG